MHEMPKPSEAHRLFEKLAGSWAGDERMYPSQWDPVGGTAQAKTHSRIAVNGFALIGDYEQSRGGAVTFSGHSIMTYDPQSGDYVLHWVDSMGMPPEVFRGKINGSKLPVTSRGPMGFARLTYDVSTPDRLGVQMEMSQDGENWKKLFDSVYTKQRPTPTKTAPRRAAAKTAKAPAKKKPVAGKKAATAKKTAVAKKPVKKAKSRR